LHEAFTILGYENDNPSAATPSPSFGINRSTTAVGINPPTVVAGCSNSKHPQKIGTAGNNQSKIV